MPDGNSLVNHYDAEGLGAEIEENNRLTKFIFHQDTILAELDAEDNTKARLITGHGVVAANINGMDNNYYYHQDEQGSTAIITDENADIKNSYHYDAFGKILESQEELPNRITYTGQQYDPLTQQYYLRARYYNPIIGRFTQGDTYRGDGLNLYAYCSNNPISYYDPSGYSQEASPPCKAPAVTDAEGKDPSVGTDEPDLYHYTTKKGAEAIQSSGVIRPDDRGRVFVTTDQISASDVNNTLLMGQKTNVGTHVVEIILADKNDYKLTIEGATQPNELIYNGAIRNGRNAILSVKENGF